MERPIRLLGQWTCQKERAALRSILANRVWVGGGFELGGVVLGLRRVVEVGGLEDLDDAHGVGLLPAAEQHVARGVLAGGARLVLERDRVDDAAAAVAHVLDPGGDLCLLAARLVAQPREVLKVTFY